MPASVYPQVNITTPNSSQIFSKDNPIGFGGAFSPKDCVITISFQSTVVTVTKNNNMWSANLQPPTGGWLLGVFDAIVTASYGGYGQQASINLRVY